MDTEASSGEPPTCVEESLGSEDMQVASPLPSTSAPSVSELSLLTQGTMPDNLQPALTPSQASTSNPIDPDNIVQTPHAALPLSGNGNDLVQSPSDTKLMSLTPEDIEAFSITSHIPADVNLQLSQAHVHLENAGISPTENNDFQPIAASPSPPPDMETVSTSPVPESGISQAESAGPSQQSVASPAAAEASAQLQELDNSIIYMGQIKPTRTLSQAANSWEPTQLKLKLIENSRKTGKSSHYMTEQLTYHDDLGLLFASHIPAKTVWMAKSEQDEEESQTSPTTRASASKPKKPSKPIPPVQYTKPDKSIQDHYKKHYLCQYVYGSGEVCGHDIPEACRAWFHMGRHFGMLFCCSICSRWFETANKLSKHYQSYHNPRSLTTKDARVIFTDKDKIILTGFPTKPNIKFNLSNMKAKEWFHFAWFWCVPPTVTGLTERIPNGHWSRLPDKARVDLFSLRCISDHDEARFNRKPCIMTGSNRHQENQCVCPRPPRYPEKAPVDQKWHYSHITDPQAQKEAIGYNSVLRKVTYEVTMDYIVPAPAVIPSTAATQSTSQAGNEAATAEPEATAESSQPSTVAVRTQAGDFPVPEAVTSPAPGKKGAKGKTFKIPLKVPKGQRQPRQTRRSDQNTPTPTQGKTSGVKRRASRSPSPAQTPSRKAQPQPSDPRRTDSQGFTVPRNVAKAQAHQKPGKNYERKIIPPEPKTCGLKFFPTIPEEMAISDHDSNINWTLKESYRWRAVTRLNRKDPDYSEIDDEVYRHLRELILMPKKVFDKLAECAITQMNSPVNWFNLRFESKLWCKVMMYVMKAINWKSPRKTQYLELFSAPDKFKFTETFHKQVLQAVNALYLKKWVLAGQLIDSGESVIQTQFDADDNPYNHDLRTRPYFLHKLDAGSQPQKLSTGLKKKADPGYHAESSAGVMETDQEEAAAPSAVPPSPTLGEFLTKEIKSLLNLDMDKPQSLSEKSIQKIQNTMKKKAKEWGARVEEEEASSTEVTPSKSTAPQGPTFKLNVAREVIVHEPPQTPPTAGSAMDTEPPQKPAATAKSPAAASDSDIIIDKEAQKAMKIQFGDHGRTVTGTPSGTPAPTPVATPVRPARSSSQTSTESIDVGTDSPHYETVFGDRFEKATNKLVSRSGSDANGVQMPPPLPQAPPPRVTRRATPVDPTTLAARVPSSGSLSLGPTKSIPLTRVPPSSSASTTAPMSTASTVTTTTTTITTSASIPSSSFNRPTPTQYPTYPQVYGYPYYYPITPSTQSARPDTLNLPVSELRTGETLKIQKSRNSGVTQQLSPADIIIRNGQQFFITSDSSFEGVPISMLPRDKNSPLGMFPVHKREIKIPVPEEYTEDWSPAIKLQATQQKGVLICKSSEYHQTREQCGWSNKDCLFFGSSSTAHGPQRGGARPPESPAKSSSAAGSIPTRMDVDETPAPKPADELNTVSYDNFDLTDSCGIRDRRIRTFGSWKSIEEFCEHKHLELNYESFDDLILTSKPTLTYEFDADRAPSAIQVLSQVPRWLDREYLLQMAVQARDRINAEIESSNEPDHVLGDFGITQEPLNGYFSLVAKCEIELPEHVSKVRESLVKLQHQLEQDIHVQLGNLSPDNKIPVDARHVSYLSCYDLNPEDPTPTFHLPPSGASQNQYYKEAHIRTLSYLSKILKWDMESNPEFVRSVREPDAFNIESCSDSQEDLYS